MQWVVEATPMELECPTWWCPGLLACQSEPRDGDVVRCGARLGDLRTTCRLRWMWDGKNRIWFPADPPANRWTTDLPTAATS
jgi:hypothetical protein